MDVEYPLWLPMEEWTEFVKMRKKIKKPLTDFGQKLALRKLDELKGQGHDPITVLEQSIFHDYAGLFPPKLNFQEQSEAELDAVFGKDSRR